MSVGLENGFVKVLDKTGSLIELHPHAGFHYQPIFYDYVHAT